MSRRTSLAWVCAALLAAASAHAETRTWFGFQIGVGNAPPPEFGWRTAPHVVIERDVAIVDDPGCPDDVFRCSGAWWRYHDGWWWRGRDWRGPWRATDVRYVPRAVLVVPDARWRHHPHGGPPGQLKKRGWGRDDERDDERGHGHGRGHGRGRGHDRDEH